METLSSKSIALLKALAEMIERKGGINGGIIVAPTELNKEIDQNAMGPFWDKDVIKESIAWCEKEGFPLLPLSISVTDDMPMQNREITKMARGGASLAPAVLKERWKTEIASIERMDAESFAGLREKLSKTERITSASKDTKIHRKPSGSNAQDGGGGWWVDIPFQRKDIPQSTCDYTFKEDSSMKEKFEVLKQFPDYKQILDIYRAYVFKTIPAPADTAGDLWVVTALPSTGNSNRYGAITCQNVETLVLCKAEPPEIPHPWGYFNALPADGVHYPDLNGYWTDNYESLGCCLQYRASTLNELQIILSNEDILDCCYRINSELLRKGGSMMARYNNPYLVEAILEAGPLEG